MSTWEDMNMRRKRSTKGLQAMWKKACCNRTLFPLVSWGHHTFHHCYVCTIPSLTYYALPLSVSFPISYFLPASSSSSAPSSSLWPQVGSHKKKQTQEGKGEVLLRQWNLCMQAWKWTGGEVFRQRKGEREFIKWWVGQGQWLHSIRANIRANVFLGFISNKAGKQLSASAIGIFLVDQNNSSNKRTHHQLGLRVAIEVTIITRNLQWRTTGINWDPFQSSPLTAPLVFIYHHQPLLVQWNMGFHLGHLSFIGLLFIARRSSLYPFNKGREGTVFSLFMPSLIPSFPPCSLLLLPPSSPVNFSLAQSYNLLPFAFDPFISYPFLHNPARASFFPLLPWCTSSGRSYIMWIGYVHPLEKQFSFRARQ